MWGTPLVLAFPPALSTPWGFPTAPDSAEPPGSVCPSLNPSSSSPAAAISRDTFPTFPTDVPRNAFPAAFPEGGTQKGPGLAQQFQGEMVNRILGLRATDVTGP